MDKGNPVDLPVEPTNEITLWGVRKIVDAALRRYTALHIAGLEQIQDNDGGAGGAVRGAPQFRLTVAGGATGQVLKDLGDELERGIAKAGPPKWARWANVTVGGPRGSGADVNYEFILHMPPGVFVKKFWKEESEMDDFRRLVGLGDALVEAVRPAKQGDFATSEDEAVILFQDVAQAQVIYDMLTGAGGGVRLLEPGEVILRDMPEWQQVSLNFAPHVRYLKPEVIAAVLDAIGEYVEEAAWDEAAAALAEDFAALVEFNPYHTADDGTFASPEQLKQAKHGSWSDGRRKRKVGKGRGKGKALKLVAAKRPCGREARQAGKDKRCWEDQRLSWTGHAVARVLRKARAAGCAEGALTADDRVILERAVRAWATRASALGEGKNFSMKLTADDAKKINSIKLFHGVVRDGDDWLKGWPEKWEDVAREALLAVRDGEMDYAMKLIARLQSKIESHDAIRAALGEAKQDKKLAADGAVLDEKTREQMDAERAAKRKEGYKWSVDLRGEHDDPEQSSQARLENKYGDVMGTVTWWDTDEARDKFRAETMVPGVRGKTQLKGRYASLEKAKAAVMQELGLGEARRSVGELLSELGGQTFGRGSRGRDPYWMTAKYAGKAKDGTPFKKGDRVFYYPATKTILAGAAAEKAAADFQGAVDDERQYNSGFEDVDNAGLLALIEGMDEAALNAFAAEIDEALTSAQRQAKKDYKRQDWGKTQQKADLTIRSMGAISKYSTKRLMSMAKAGAGPGPGNQAMHKAIMMALRARITKGKKSGKLKLRAK